MSMTSDERSIHDTIITNTDRRHITEATGYSRSALEVQVLLTQYARKLQRNRYGLILGREGILEQFRCDVPIVLGRQNSELSKDDFFNLKPFGAENLGVSRIHARLYYEDDSLYAEDMNSRNGTFINGEQINTFEPRELKHGDRLRFGNLMTVVVFAEDAPRSASVLHLTAAIATEDSLQFLTEQLTPYLLALAEVQRVFLGISTLSADLTKQPPVRYGEMTLSNTAAIIQAENIFEAVMFIEGLQEAQQREPYRPVEDLVQEIADVDDLMDEDPSAVEKLAALAKQMLGTRIILTS